MIKSRQLTSAFLANDFLPLLRSKPHWSPKDIQLAVKESIRYEAYASSHHVFQVRDINDVFADLDYRTCTCRKWELRGYPLKGTNPRLIILRIHPLSNPAPGRPKKNGKRDPHEGPKKTKETYKAWSDNDLWQMGRPKTKQSTQELTQQSTQQASQQPTQESIKRGTKKSSGWGKSKGNGNRGSCI
ncbi:hypothetical protein QVD17_19875 [Tagetes erecta]|uniref:Uncharacterized protein n=1 Tax=Tagetes erecta TaxID=13708 RepID=A0AAD8KK85_TARER|nr:hypothetical protein QVD17_19875 [Tagetes erecta]